MFTTRTALRAGYAIPPHDKKDDDLGGPGGQEAPNPEHRKRTNRSLGGQAAMIIALGVGCVAIFSTFAAPRQIAQHQIDNDTVIGGPNSNTGGSLAKVKHREGTKTSHQLHDEQTGSSVLGNK
ncbi:hypothetical protein M406DRAFT_330985 [Cryphonectria parasitica EP155]|uniref:Uncharacterized protein n=1 Tax=Cryphonectria parasitica (strain ATCC 38755 / EP155) TaxID=660469 RepID=A0A9P4Y153_CRYP1|nr:uncharacterized protein M406DRAFT_330985 [Cryphonectria parasitica EP155]KAF3764656.1 hypothetical protein M406DRAFT_330985 [Cryphonectria parasitica EP155]